MPEKYTAVAIPQEIDQTDNDIVKKLSADIRMSDAEKEQLFSPSLPVMSSLLSRTDLNLPPNFLSRLYIVGDHAFRNTYLQFIKKDPWVSKTAGTCFFNRICALNYDEISSISKQDSFDFSDLILMYGLHELWHSLEYRENWINQNAKPSLDHSYFIRRSGIVTKRPGKLTVTSIGLHRLREGFTDMLTFVSLKMLGKHNISIGYYNEGEIVLAMGKAIGTAQPFWQAQFNKKGFRALYLSMENRFGRDSLSKIAICMGADWMNSVAKNPNQEPEYPLAQKLINSWFSPDQAAQKFRFASEGNIQP